MLSAFSAAITHYKRASVALPWHQSERFGRADCKDYEAAKRAIETLPPLRSLVPPAQSPSSSQQAPLLHQAPEYQGYGGAHHQPAVSRPGETSRILLEWLLGSSAGGRRSPRMMRRITADELAEQLRILHGPGIKIGVPASGAKAPDYVFENLGLPPLPSSSYDALQPTPSSSSSSTLAWHGTSFERLHSITSTGLQPASGTRLQRNGANHGGGRQGNPPEGSTFKGILPPVTQ